MRPRRARDPARLGDLLRSTARALAASGIEAPVLEARVIAQHVLGLGPETVIGHPERSVTPAHAAEIEAVVRRRARAEPMAYILGEREFWSLPLRVDRNVLIPRPDTEVVVETALRHAPADAGRPFRVLDLGTGSGCILLALLSERRAATGVGVDASQAAIVRARDNARRLGLAERCTFVCADWGGALSGAFDAIVSNPPYIAEGDYERLEAGVRVFEPAAALRGGGDGLDAYRALRGDLARLLAPGGFVIIEIGAGRRRDVAAVLGAGPLRIDGVHRDLSGRERCLSLVRARDDALEPMPASTRGKKWLGSQAFPDYLGSEEERTAPHEGDLASAVFYPQSR